ncbi:hypothetical protein CJ030_MR2G013627 [Morella rubra]|uniref:F-box domain-containing protein n=1 Tax=Morella rubra TaxID=262757 RepID=A0A6A1WDE1_9ROSI|nr:hypothetical protein CJ030_MR2G013627 [Morella rubra]
MLNPLQSAPTGKATQLPTMLSCKSMLSQTLKRKKKNKSKTRNKTTNRTVSRKQNSFSKKLELPHQEYEEEQEQQDIEEGFSLKTSTAPSHTHGVQPLSNLYLSPGSIDSRNTGLGNLQALSDELVLDILGLLGGTHLGVLATVSKSFYVFGNHEPLWRNLVLENLNVGFLYNGSWKQWRNQDSSEGGANS